MSSILVNAVFGLGFTIQLDYFILKPSMNITEDMSRSISSSWVTKKLRIGRDVRTEIQNHGRTNTGKINTSSHPNYSVCSPFSFPPPPPFLFLLFHLLLLLCLLLLLLSSSSSSFSSSSLLLLFIFLSLFLLQSFCLSSSSSSPLQIFNFSSSFHFFSFSFSPSPPFPPSHPFFVSFSTSSLSYSILVKIINGC